MNASRFDKIVKNRAQSRIEARIQIFRKTIETAIHELTGSKINPQYIGHFWKTEFAEEIITGLRSNTWPLEFWEREEEAVQKELLSTMDEMQKALCTPDVVVTESTPTPTPESPSSKK